MLFSKYIEYHQIWQWGIKFSYVIYQSINQIPELKMPLDKIKDI